MLENIWKKAIHGLGTAAVIIGILLAWEQLNLGNAKAEDVNKNEKNIGILIESVKTLVYENRRLYLRNSIIVLNEKIYKLERRYHSGERNMSSQTKEFYQRMLEDKTYLEQQLRK